MEKNFPLYGRSEWPEMSERWRTLLSPGLVKGLWSQDEDQFIKALYQNPEV
jgi:hypothetical protein